MSNILNGDKGSYLNVYTLRDAFRRAGGVNDTIASNFNETDTPITTYFRLFFYFNNGRLLDTYHINDENVLREAHKAGGTIGDTALNYLYLNNEFERANMLRTFIDLLSNINTYSPWYFQKISGVEMALARPELGGNEFKISEEAKVITINCLPDAYDNRIGTMLDAYRAACFSQRLHKEIIPANLRKFDMALYIFSTPIRNMHNREVPILNEDGTRYIMSNLRVPSKFSHEVDLGNNTKYEFGGADYMTSSKLIEFRNCEIDLNSNASAFSDLDNAEGKQLEYQIQIKYDSAYEQRYNEFLVKYIGDMVAWDINYNLSSDEERDYFAPELADVDTTDSLDPMDNAKSIVLNKLDEHLQHFKNNYHLDRGETLGLRSSLGSTYKDRFGLSENIDKISAGIANVIDKYDPIANATRAVNSLTGAASSMVGQLVSDVVFGNIYYDSKGLRGLAENLGSKLVEREPTRSKPSSSVGKNIYKGWTQTSTNKTAVGANIFKS